MGSCVRAGCCISAAVWWRAVGASSGYARAWGGAQASGPAAGKKAAPKSSVKMKEDKKHAHVSEYCTKDAYWMLA